MAAASLSQSSEMLGKQNQIVVEENIITCHNRGKVDEQSS